jgi:large subunit ribosomal protein L35
MLRFRNLKVQPLNFMFRRPNIPLSCTQTTRLAKLQDHTPYIPPHPQKGTPYHRYVLLLLPQPPITSYSRNAVAKADPGVPTSRHLEIPKVPDDQRLGFDLRSFVKEWNLHPAKGGGANMWREVWDDTVSKIYRLTLSKWYSVRSVCCF